MFATALLLLPFTALSLGAVHAPAFAVMEVVIFGLGAVWMGLAAFGFQRLTRSDTRLRWLAAAVVAVPVLLAAQLVPMPPALLARLAPASYEAYAAGLPGWPDGPAYGWIERADTLSPRHYFLPTPDEVSEGALVPFTPAGPAPPTAAGIKAGAWMPVSVAPLLTGPALLKLAAYSTVFVLLVLYPFSSQQERRLARSMMKAVLITGVAISLVGLAEQLHSNGKPLWIFNPYEWPHGSPWGVRIYGPFANPDHYAGYLAMVWPFALAGVLIPNRNRASKEPIALPILSASIGLASLAALIVTGSRGGWLAAAVATAVVLSLMQARPIERRPGLLLMGHSHRPLLAVALVAATLCLIMALTANSSRTEADRRFASAINSGGLEGRSLPSIDSLMMIEQSPLLGVGLGAWPVLYPKYASPPWISQYMNAAHNDYVQWFAENGSLGFAAAVAVLYLVFGQVKRTLCGLSSERFPAAAACAAALAGIAAHSLVDFPLRVPANALLAATCLGVLTRLCSPQISENTVSWKPGLCQRAAAMLLLALFLTAAGLALLQPVVPYPFDLRPPASPREAVAQILKYPPQARLHLALAELIGDRGDAIKREEINAALRLEPHNPLAHDLYAGELARDGQSRAALDQIEQSLFYAPDAQSHIYLSGRYFRWLPSDEHAPIEEGLRRAVAENYAPAIVTLTQFYSALGRFHDEAQLLASQAMNTPEDERRAAEYNQAGLAYLAATEPDQAAQAFKLAIAADPADFDAYKNLGIGLYAKRGAFDAARQILGEGLSNGAPAAPLYLALAQVQRDRGNLKEAEETLEEAAAEEPGNLEIARGLGDIYFANDKFDRAALWYRKASQLAPRSAEIYFALGRAEEAGYQYFAADHDLAEAAELNNGQQNYGAYYAEFKKKVANARTP